MKKFFSLCLLMSFLNLSIGLPVLAAKSTLANPVAVKSGTRIPITFKAESTSKQITAGQRVEAIIQDDIKINNVVVFKKDANATLNVSDVKKAKFCGIPGEIVLVNGTVTDANGQEHLVEYNQKVVGEEKNWPKVCVGCGMFIILAPLVLFGFVKGGQAKISPYQPVNAVIRNDFDFVPENL